MSGRILIIDTVATNRIVLKVKMHAAQYAVDTCGSRAEAETMIRQMRPDLILVNLSDHSEDRHAFCRDLKDDPDTADIAIIALGVADTCRARFAALDAGADEVIPTPTDDTLLLARIRSLLRMRHTYAELWLRDGTSRALGFDETPTPYAPMPRIAAILPQIRVGNRVVAKLNTAFPRHLEMLTSDEVLAQSDMDGTIDLYIIDGTGIDDQGRDLFRLVADLRARSQARLSMQMVVVPKGMTEVAAMALDLGADDVVFDHVGPAEWALRAQTLLKRKALQDKLRTTVRNGLQAAVTDPLTGLYNRRYADPHLERMEQQARKLGQEFAVMMLDIDFFKSVNDTYGHAAGDAVLREMANRLRSNLRAFDLIARVGGEEFLVAMPNTNAVDAQAAADRLRHIVNDEPFAIAPGKPRLPVTISIGVAVGGTSGPVTLSCDEMCHNADAALYAAKSAGRNQVSLAKSAA